MSFSALKSLAVEPNGAVYVADVYGMHHVSPLGVVTASALAINVQGGAMRFAADGTSYVVDEANNRILAIAPTLETRVLAGPAFGAEGLPSKGYADGASSSARFSQPKGLDVDSAGVVWVADTGNHRIRKIAPDGTVTTAIGFGRVDEGDARPVDGPVASAQLSFPSRVAVDPSGLVYMIDGYGGITLRRLSADGVVTTLMTLPPGDVNDRMTDLVVEPDGGVLFSRGPAIYRWNPTGEPAVVARTFDGDQLYPRSILGFSRGPDGQLYAIDESRLYRQSPDDATRLMPLAGRSQACATR